jgi:gliding motility-associated-like protein
MRSFFKLLFLAITLQVVGLSEAFGQCPSITGATNTVTDISCFGLTDGSITIRLNTGGVPTNYELFDLNAGEFVPVNVAGDPTSVQRVIDPDFMGVTFTNVYGSLFRIHIFKTACAAVLYSGGGGFSVDEPTQVTAAPVTTADCEPLTGPGNQDGSITLNPSGGNTPYSFLWNDGATTEDRNNVDAGTYEVIITDQNGCQDTVSNIVVLGTPTITLGANPSVCLGATSASLSYSATTVGPDQYSINFDAAAEAQGFVDVTNSALPATPITITIPGAAIVGTYNATLTVRNSTTGCISTASAISVTINANPTITLGANPSVCSGTTSASLSYSATTGSPNQYSINFDATAEAQGFVDVTNSALPATPIIITIPGAAVAGTYNATLSVRNGTSGCVSGSSAISITINPSPTITLGTNPSVCLGATSANLSYSATTGSPNQYSINFNAAAEAQGFVDVVNAALPATPIVITLPGAAVAGTYNATLTVRNSTTTCVSASSAISVTIANPTITLGANPSVCSGSTSASLTYSATTSSPDQYSINFDATAEAQGFVDITNALLPASPIIITVPGAAIVGTYNATLTVRNSTTGCVSTASAISVTINTNPTITLGTNPSVCSGTTSANLSYSATTGSPNQYSINFDATAEAQGFADVTNAALPPTPIIITVPGAAVVGTYNATLTVRNSTTGCISGSSAISVTINTTPTITLGANPSVCSGSTSATLSYSATTGSPNQYSINFDASAEGQGFVDIVNAVLPATPINITVPGAAVAGTYNATLTVRNSTTNCVSTSSAITVTISANPSITLGTNPSVCSGVTNANLTYSLPTGSPNQYSINFDATAEAQGFVDVVNSALPATPIGIAVPAAAAIGTYNATLTVRNSTTGCVSSASAITITINERPTITLGANPSVCSGSTSASLPYTATTGSPNRYSINFNAAAEAQGFVDVTNAVLPATPITITVPGAAAVGTFNATLTVRNTATNCTSPGSSISVTINANPTITLGTNPSVCSGSTSATLPYSATTGSPNQYSINFDATAEAQGFVDVVNAVLPVTPIIITVPGAAVAGTYNATLTVRNNTTTCVSTASAISVTINANPTITLGSNPSVCLGATSANLSYSATTGSPNQYSINFDAAAEAQGFVDVVNAVLPATPIVISVPGAAIAGTYNGTITILNTTTNCTSASSAISVTIASPSITLGANPSVCFGSTSADLPYSATTGTPDQYSIDFDAAAEAQGFVDVVNAALPVSPIVVTVPGTAVNGTYNGSLTVRNSGGGCVSSSSAISVTITSPSITLGTNPLVCSGTTSANLTYSATSGSPDQYSINFDATAEAQGFVDVVNAVLPATPIVITVPGAAIVGTYNAILTVRNSTTTCVSTSSAITVTINENPTITLGTNPSVCSASTSASLSYSATTGTPSQYSIDFDATAEAQGFVDVVNAVLPASPILIVVPGGAAINTYNGTLTVHNTTTNCSSISSAISVTITSSPTITLGTNPSVCSGVTSANLSYSATTGSPDQYSIDFDAASEAVGFVDVVNAILPVTPISIVIPGGAANGTYNGSLTVRNSGASCVSAPSAISVTIVGNPTITLGVSPIVCSGSTSANLTYSATTNGANRYSIDFNAAAEAQGFVDVVNAILPATPIIITVPGAAVANTYSATLIVSNNVTTCVSTSNAITVTITANPTITLGTNPTVCEGTASADLTYSAVSGSPDQYSIDFDVTAEAEGFLDVTNATLTASPIVIVVPGAAVAGTYNGSLVIHNSGSGCNSLATPITVTIVSSPDQSLTVGSTIDPVCSGGVGGVTIALSENGVSYQLRNDVDDSAIGTPVLGNGGTITLSTGVLTATTTFNIIASVGTCSAELTNTITVNVSGSIDGSLAVSPQDATICEGSATQINISNSDPSVNYQLRNDLDDSNINAPVAGNGGTLSLSTNNLSISTTFNILASNGSCSAELLNLATVNVDTNPNVGLTVGVTIDPLCTGGTSGITIDNSETGVSYQLRNDTDDSNVGSAVVGTGGTITLSTGALATTTIFNVLATNGVCPSVELTTTATVNVSGTIDASLILIAQDDPICEGTSTFIIIQNSENLINYQLRDDSDDSNIGTPVVGDGNDIMISTDNLSSTTTFNVLADNGSCSIELTSLVTVNVDVNPNSLLTVGTTSGTVCPGVNGGVTVANSQLGVSYQLRNDAGDVAIGSPVTGTGGTITLSTSALVATTTFNVLATSGVCSPVELNNTVTITVLSAGDPACTAGDCSDLVITPSPIAPTCAGLNDGSIVFDISLFPSNGNSNFRVTVTNLRTGGISTANGASPVTVSGLLPDQYHYKVEDLVNGHVCDVPGNLYQLIRQTTVVATADNDSFQDVSCFGDSTGVAIIDATNSTTGDYFYSLDGNNWTTFIPGNPINTLPPNGTYIIYVGEIANDACRDTVLVTINNINPQIDFPLSSYSVTGSSCNAGDGSITIENDATGGSGSPYTYLLDGNIQPVNNEFQNLFGGDHTLTVTDGAGCERDFVITVPSPDAIEIGGLSGSDASCNANGSITIIIDNYLPAVQYQVGISNNLLDVPADDEFIDQYYVGNGLVIITELPRGDYFVWLRAGVGQCPTIVNNTIGNAAITINGPYAVDFDFTCRGNSGELTLTNIVGDSVNQYDFVYEIFQNGFTFPGVITYGESINPYTTPAQFTPFDPMAPFQIKLRQDQIIAGCVIETPFKDAPLGALDTLSVVKAVSFPDQPTGSIQVRLQESFEDPYSVWLVSPSFLSDTILAAKNPVTYEANFTTLDAGSYDLYVEDAHGCRKEYLIVLPFDGRIFIPNIFTPNNDGVNDVFYVRNLSDGSKLSITNRWGKEVYSSNNYNLDNLWDGGGAPDGVYYYRLQISGGSTYSGWVEILRGNKP